MFKQYSSDHLVLKKIWREIWMKYWDYLSTVWDTDAFWNSRGDLKTFPRIISQINLHLIFFVSIGNVGRDVFLLSYRRLVNSTDVGLTSCSQENNSGLSVTPEAQWYTFPLQITTTCCQQTTKHPPIPAALHTHARRHACSTSNHQLLKKRPLCLNNYRSVCSLIMMLH